MYVLEHYGIKIGEDGVFLKAIGIKISKAGVKHPGELPIVTKHDNVETFVNYTNKLNTYNEKCTKLYRDRTFALSFLKRADYGGLI